jgi:hypothetical protein
MYVPPGGARSAPLLLLFFLHPASALLLLTLPCGGADSGSRWTVASTHHFGLIPRLVWPETAPAEQSQILGLGTTPGFPFKSDGSPREPAGRWGLPGVATATAWFGRAEGTSGRVCFGVYC